MRALRALLLTLLLAGLLPACGFHLRGAEGQFNMPFQSIYLGFPASSPLGVELKRYLRGVNTQVVNTEAEAEARLDVVAENRGKTILSLNSQGRVREYTLSYALTFRVRDAKGRELIAPTELALKRTISFNETQTLAKESEEALLYRDMQSDLVQQILRRLAALKTS